MRASTNKVMLWFSVGVLLAGLLNVFNLGEILDHVFWSITIIYFILVVSLDKRRKNR